MNPNSYNAWQDTQRRNTSLPPKGKLGYFVDGQFRIEVEDDLSVFYVRFGDYSFREVPHKGRISPPPTLATWESQNIPVRLGIDLEGDYSILGFDLDQSNALLQLYGGGLYLPPHSAILHTHIAQPEGLIRKTGNETYAAIKTNLGAAGDPGVDDDNTEGYGVLSLWTTTAGKAFLCVSAATGAAVWRLLSGINIDDNITFLQAQTGILLDANYFSIGATGGDFELIVTLKGEFLDIVFGAVQDIVAEPGIVITEPTPNELHVGADIDGLPEIVDPDPTTTYFMVSTPEGLRKLRLISVSLTGVLIDNDSSSLIDDDGSTLVG